jgi:hypothetical protein
MLCVSHEIVTSYVDKLMSARTPPTAVVRRADVWAHRQSARSAYAWRCSARRIVSGKKIERSANPSGSSAREGFFIFWSTRQVRGSPSTRRQRLTSAAGAATINFEIYGDVVQREDRCFASSQCRFDSDRLHQFAGVAQWESACLPSRRSPDRSRFPAPLRPSALASGCAL